MAKEYKTLRNMGLAFDETRILKKFSDMAKQGWILNEMTAMKYKLVKAAPENLIFTLDYNEVKGNEQEYYELFESAGWKHRCSYGLFHFFSAAPGTVPIYTDRESYINKYKGMKTLYLKMLIISAICLLVSTIASSVFDFNAYSPIIGTVVFIAGAISAMVMLPSLMVSVAYAVRTMKK